MTQIPSCNKMNQSSFLIAFLVLFFATYCLAGKDDTLDQLAKTYGNINMDDEFVQVPVEALYGSVPPEMEGTFARHGCGVFGYSTRYEVEGQLDRVTQLFDCIETAHSFSFLDGKAFFTSKFYDTAKNDIFRDQYNQDLSESSVFWVTIYSDFNVTQLQKHQNELYNSNKTDSLNHVSWWMIDNDVIAMGEFPEGDNVDPHNGEYIDAYPFIKDLTPNGFDKFTHIWNEFNPAHQASDKNLGLISTTGVYGANDDNKVSTSRIVYSLKKKDGNLQSRLLAQINYKDSDWTADCKYPEEFPMEARLRYLHTIATTENYIVIPESSSSRNPCKAQFPAFKSVEYNPKVNGRFHVIPKPGNEDQGPIIWDLADQDLEWTLEAEEDFFITHLFNAFEEDNLIHVDVLMYDYDIYPELIVSDFVFGPNDMKNYIKRYTLDMESKNVSSSILLPQEDGYIEFNNINPNFLEKPYRYGYAVKNVFRRNNAIVKFDFQTQESLEYELPDGEFGTEPIFVPNGSGEDDGFVVVNTLNGALDRSEILILWAKNMKPQFKGRAPGKGLQGLHSAFFPFDKGCHKESGCKPEIPSMATKADITLATLTLVLAFSVLLFHH